MTGKIAAGGRAEVRITPSDVGKRVSLRRVLEVVDGRPVFGDVVGLLASWNNGVLAVVRRDGQEVRVAEASLVAAKPVPAAPARRRGPRADARQLALVASRGWPPRESEALGGWVLRCAAGDPRAGTRSGKGFTRRANSVLPLGDPGMPLDAALERVRDWYGARGLDAVVQVTTGDAAGDEELAAELDRRGWTPEGHAVLRTGTLAALAEAADDEAVGRVRLSRDPDAAWAARYRWAGGLDDNARAVLTGGPSVWFAAVDGEGGEEGVPDAVGRCVVDGRWAGFAALEVDPGQRRRGLATAVTAALARRALSEGADAAYLQVERDNRAAAALYDRLGLTEHHAYHYRRAPRSGR
ncbi:GNAT family N-acetyltransferase [Streptomyces sp. SCUT-3]|uniref:GNAT family N-acetyltransferase n=1 Tax=Streptomyces sp. SCUT-3 TaxID=2684469 RepID=UPI0015FC232A|nr:GNAT family N-acetyltransferase [Streptomyces sp. SCUT-3]